MNDTNLNQRQKKVLEIIKETGYISRLNIAKKLSSDSNFSRITLIRDLNLLIKEKILKKTGKGKNVQYRLLEVNPLLIYIDLENYFKKESEERIINKTFKVNIFTHLHNLYSPEEINLWEKGKKVFQNAKTNLDSSIYKRELERFIIELSWKSSQIEGNTYSLVETETLIKQNIKAVGHSEEEAVMILNHKKAFDVILEKKDTFQKLDFADIIQLHQVLTAGLVTSGVRSQKVRITGTQYQPLYNKQEIEKALRQLIKHVNNTKYPPEKALILAIMIAYLQPFADGNKRTSRILSNALLLAYDYLPLSYRNVNINEYRNSLIIFYETNNLYNFKHIYLDQLRFAIANYFQQ